LRISQFVFLSSTTACAGRAGQGRVSSKGGKRFPAGLALLRPKI
jgi:hypothetical protein